VNPTNSKKNKSTDAGPEWVNNLFPISWGIPWYTQYIGYFNMEHDYDIVKSNGFSKLPISSTRTPGSGRRPQVPHQVVVVDLNPASKRMASYSQDILPVMP
jgi:hypothetical protein